MAVIILLVILGMITSGAVGYFLAYLKNEKESKGLNNKTGGRKNGEVSVRRRRAWRCLSRNRNAQAI